MSASDVSPTFCVETLPSLLTKTNVGTYLALNWPMSWLPSALLVNVVELELDLALVLLL